MDNSPPPPPDGAAPSTEGDVWRWPTAGVRFGRRVTVNTEGVKACIKCGRSGTTIYRHHKGYDSFLGIFNQGILGNYNKWLDCCYLCFDCHCTIHFIYERYLKPWINRTPMGAKHMRQKLIEVCDSWLAGKVKTPSVPKRFIRQFQRSHAQWLKSQEQTSLEK